MNQAHLAKLSCLLAVALGIGGLDVEEKNIYKYDRASSVRIGNGGILIDLDAFNGDIRIVKREK